MTYLIDAWLSRPERAPVGPAMLYSLPPRTDATAPAQIAVKQPMVGVAAAATPREMERGMLTSATVKPAAQLLAMAWGEARGGGLGLVGTRRRKGGRGRDEGRADRRGVGRWEGAKGEKGGGRGTPGRRR